MGDHDLQLPEETEGVGQHEPAADIIFVQGRSRYDHDRQGAHVIRIDLRQNAGRIESVGKAFLDSADA